MEVFNRKIQEQFLEMCKTGKLFRSSISGQEVWDLYLSSFSREDDPVFRDPESTVHSCNHCNNFIRRYGNVVAVGDLGEIMTLFDVSEDGEYKNSVKVISAALKSADIKDVFFETFSDLNSLPYESCSKSNDKFRLGIHKNVKRYTKEEAELFGVVKPNELKTFNHFHLDLPSQFVDKSGKSIEQIMAFYRDKYSVFKRAMEEISLDTLNLVNDLINQGSLLDGTSHLHSIEEMIKESSKYQLCSESDTIDNWFWVVTYDMDERVAKFKNTAIGTLCSELSEGSELNEACRMWNKMVDPVNYHKATAPITQRQINEAKKFVEENDYTDSFNRKLVTIDDIKVDEILHSNVGDGKIKEVSIFDSVKSNSTQHKKSKFDDAEEISIDKFMSDILPTCTQIEVLLKNNHEGNLVTLTKAVSDESKPIFKWRNNYSWTFNGNLAGKSQIKEAVKSRGGRVDGCLNIRLAFPNTIQDYDLHIIEPGGNRIYYNNVRQAHRSSGVLDLDAQGVDGNQPPEKRVENVIYSDKSKMPTGTYVVAINNYSTSKGRDFLVEAEDDNGNITTFKHDSGLNGKETVTVCKINFDGKGFVVNPTLPITDSNVVSKQLWGMETNKFHKVNLVCLSPNHWGDNQNGNKHYMFMIDSCTPDNAIRGFHNENLNSDLLKHRKVMEVLGATNMIEPNGKQLSGVGFNSTVRDELIVKCSGSHKRMLKIKF